jgi:hypothetical protein
MTSNIGRRFIQKKASIGFQASDTGSIDKSVNDMVLGEVKRTFNPEFINRIDENHRLRGADRRRPAPDHGSCSVDQLERKPGRPADEDPTCQQR